MSAAGGRGAVLMGVAARGQGPKELRAALGLRVYHGVTAWKGDAEGEEVVSLHRALLGLCSDISLYIPSTHVPPQSSFCLHSFLHLVQSLSPWVSSACPIPMSMLYLISHVRAMRSSLCAGQLPNGKPQGVQVLHRAAGS